MKHTTALIAAASIAGAAAAEQKKVHIYNWADYFAATTLPEFEAQSGITAVYDQFDSNNMLETKLLAGSSGYDVVYPDSSRIAKLVAAGVYQKLDKSKLSNLGNIDPQFMEILSEFDPGNEYAVPYTWGTLGIFVDASALEARMPEAPAGSWEMIFNPEILEKFAGCGIYMMDDPAQMVPAALTYLGRDPASEAPEDLEAAFALLEPLRPHIRHFNQSRIVTDIATSEVCLGVVYNGDVGIAYNRAAEAGKEIAPIYSVPQEGTNIFFDTMMIPSDAPHPDTAHAFIDYILQPEVIADVTNTVYYANANLPANDLIIDEIRNDPGIYPPAEVRAKLYPVPQHSQKFVRKLNRAWTAFKNTQ